jgi:hypothetical protein
MILKHALKGLVNNIQTIPMEKICIPDPDMYSMIACIGSDFAGLLQQKKNGRAHQLRLEREECNGCHSRDGHLPCLFQLEFIRFIRRNRLESLFISRRSDLATFLASENHECLVVANDLRAAEDL